MSPSPDPTALEPRKSARQARSTATVEVIVEAAARILEAVGLSGFTTNAIAERAGVSVGSLYQYFPNKDSITRALIRRELDVLERAVSAIEMGDAASTLKHFIGVAVEQQMRRPVLAQLLDIEEERLNAGSDIDPVRQRVAAVLSKILDLDDRLDGRAVVQDAMVLIAGLVNAAASRGERDEINLTRRVEAVILALLSTPRLSSDVDPTPEHRL